MCLNLSLYIIYIDCEEKEGETYHGEKIISDEKDDNVAIMLWCIVSDT